MTRRTTKRIAALTAVLLAGACGSNDDSPGSAPPTAADDQVEVSQLALDYTKGTAGAADDSLEPITIGLINQEGAVPAFPEITPAAQAAVDYINAELGGINGHPLEIEFCYIGSSEEDGQRCAQEMLNNDDIQVVTEGVFVIGNRSVYATLEGRKPILGGVPVTGDDFAAQDAFFWTSGSIGVIPGLAVFSVLELEAKDVAIIYTDNDAGRAAAVDLAKPYVEQHGGTARTIAIADGVADATAAIRSVGAENSDVFMILSNSAGCINVYNGMQALGISPQVVSIILCEADDVLEAVGGLEALEGWYIGGYGPHIRLEGVNPEVDLYLEKMHQYGGDDIDVSDFASAIFANIMTIARVLNEIGPDEITPDALRERAAAFTGPMFLGLPNLDCGWSDAFPALCGYEMNIYQVQDGTYVPALDGEYLDPNNP